jgi:hypothetical protein
MLKSLSVALPGLVAVADAADASRRAVNAFVVMEPDKPSLAAWLVGPYREATLFGSPPIRRAQAAAPRDAGHASRTKIEDLVITAQTAVIAALDAAQGSVDDFVELLPPVVRVRPVHDVYGNRGFVPVDEEGLRLVDRVLATLAADYLTRPDDFQPNRPAISGTHATQPWMDLGLRGAGAR